MSLFNLIVGAFKKENSWSDVGTKIRTLFKKDVGEPLLAFVEQFASDFGKAALAQAAVYAPKVLSGDMKFQDAAKTAFNDLSSQALTIAAEDALTIVQNALRVQVTAKK